MKKDTLDISHLSLEAVVKLARTSGARDFTMELLQADIDNGAPVNEDGTIDLFNYSAWLYVHGYNKGVKNE